jgi:O-antigen ligase
MKIYVLGMSSVIIVTILLVLFPNEFSWVGNILGDRITDDSSIGGRLWAAAQVFSNSTITEFFFGYDRVVQHSPHNMILDAFMQSGLLGALGATFIAGYAIRVYFQGLSTGGHYEIAAAAFVTPALVRIFTAGSGMLHLSELFGLLVAANLGWQFKQQELRASELKPQTPNVKLPTDVPHAHRVISRRSTKFYRPKL